MDRLPYMLERWAGPMSLSLYLKEYQIGMIDTVLSPYLNSQITWSFYVVKEVHSSVYATYVNNDVKNDTSSFKSPIFPINLVRDLAIESVETTHFLVADIDFFISKTLRDNLQSCSHVLRKQNVILLLPTFSMNKRLLDSCRQSNTCKDCCNCEMLSSIDWSKLPTTKEELVKAVQNRTIQYFYTPYHRVINMEKYLQNTQDTLVPFRFSMKNHYEPYSFISSSIIDMAFSEDLLMILSFIHILLYMEETRLSFMNV